MPEAFSVGPLLLPTLRVGIVGALLLAIVVAGLLARVSGAPPRWVRGVADFSVLLGLLGARAGFVASNWSAYAEQPWTALYLWQPGYSPRVGVAVGVIFALWRLGGIASAKWRHALPLLGGFAIAALLVAGVNLGLRLPPGDELVLRPQSRIGGPTLQAMLGRETRERLKGDRVPAFSMHDLQGRPVTSDGLAGRVVVLNFWATWCAPCRREIPLLDDINRRYTAEGVTVLGIAVGEPAATVSTFLRDFGIDYAVWVDPPDAPVSAGLVRQFGVVGFPTTFFIDRQGVIQDVYVGELARAPLTVRMEALLRQGS
ncbi:MAG: TlpA family protein disulfide reductase [Gammaproteobacteria bacterium]|nr:TlpA family protein disulfide reductase [Gammaproteobacteria bacterium]